MGFKYANDTLERLTWRANDHKSWYVAAMKLLALAIEMVSMTLSTKTLSAEEGDKETTQ